MYAFVANLSTIAYRITCNFDCSPHCLLCLTQSDSEMIRFVVRIVSIVPNVVVVPLSSLGRRGPPSQYQHPANDSTRGTNAKTVDSRENVTPLRRYGRHTLNTVWGSLGRRRRKSHSLESGIRRPTLTESRVGFISSLLCDERRKLTIFEIWCGCGNDCIRLKIGKCTGFMYQVQEFNN